MSRPIHLLRILFKKNGSNTSFFKREKTQLQLFWWYDQKTLLFTTFGNTHCPYKSTWNTFRTMHEQKLLQEQDISDLINAMNSRNLEVRKSVFD